MLILTENAVMAVRDLAARQGVPDSGGLSITSDPSGDTITIAVADQPGPDDQVVDASGARLFLDQRAAQLLDDMALDVTVDDQGTAEFVFADRDTAGPVWPTGT